ncbi:MAG: serine/threonine-protein kinase [Isosphaeraceae bacterium]
MAIFERPKSMEKVPVDLLAVIRDSGVLPERQIADIRTRLVKGEYPVDPIGLAEQLVREKQLTVYQAKRFLSGRSHGLLVGRYVILDRIGSGSMGRVYKAHHQMMDRVVALKIIAPEISANEKVVARFQREMKLVGRLDHPNVVRAFDADQVNRTLFIVMEFVNGHSLGERLKKGPIPPAEMFDFAAQAALGLAHAHEQGMVHRDIKPSNMLLTQDRKIKILDLGLGLLLEADNHSTFATADGIAVGTVDYMSPEQAMGREVDGRSDLFSLGCAMFHLMTGKLAFPGDSPIDRLGRRLNSKPVAITDYIPEMPLSAVRVLEKLMANKPVDRYATALEAAEALQAVVRPRNRTPRSSNPTVDVRTMNTPEEPRPAPPGADRSRSSQEIPEALARVSTDELPSPATRSSLGGPRPPAWFRPLARLAEARPAAALAALLSITGLVFAAGFAAGYLLR